MRALLLIALVAGCASHLPPPRAAAVAAPSPPRVAVAPPTQPPPADVGSQVDPAAAPPAYDLEADLARIASLAKQELGAAAQTRVAEGVFVLVAAPGWSPASLAASEALTEGAIDAYLTGRFDKRPERAVAVYLFADKAAYVSYCARVLGAECGSPFGVYYPNLRRIVMNAGPGLGTLTHELVHPIFEADFPSGPTWLNEGIASLFEAPVMPKRGEIHGTKNWRLPRLLAGMASPDEAREARVDALFGMGDEAFRDEREKLHYATARYFCQWLDAQGRLWPFYRAYRDGFAADPTGEKAFERVMGESPSAANAAWRAWVGKL